MSSPINQNERLHLSMAILKGESINEFTKWDGTKSDVSESTFDSFQLTTHYVKLLTSSEKLLAEADPERSLREHLESCDKAVAMAQDLIEPALQDRISIALLVAFKDHPKDNPIGPALIFGFTALSLMANSLEHLRKTFYDPQSASIEEVNIALNELNKANSKLAEATTCVYLGVDILQNSSHELALNEAKNIFKESMSERGRKAADARHSPVRERKKEAQEWFIRKRKDNPKTTKASCYQDIAEKYYVTVGTAEKWLRKI